MGSYRRLTKARLFEILRRQDPSKFGPGYEPAIKPTREEAPPHSRPAWVWSELLQRDVSTLSDPERAVLAVVLYSDRLFELQEQRMLPYLPGAPHPLTGHPLAQGMVLPVTSGSLEIAASLGALKFHPVVQEDPQVADDGTQQVATELEPGCWIGDFLLFLRDAAGPYCVNLSVKNTRSAFRRPSIGVTPKSNLKRLEEREAARHLVEERLYAEWDIPTHLVAVDDELDAVVVANLKQLLLWQKRRHPFSEDQVQQIVGAFTTAMGEGVPALEVLHLLELSEGFAPYNVKIVMYQAIWNRQLRVNLFEHFFTDRPLTPESRDVLEVYGDYFQRGGRQ